MSPVRKLPYFTAKPEHLTIGEWQLITGETTYPLPQVLPGWDPAVDIKIFTTAQVNASAIQDDCQLDNDAVLRLGVVWESLGTRLRGNGSAVDIHVDTAKTEYQLDVEVSGTLLGRSVRFTVYLLLMSQTEARSRFTPVSTGSTLAARYRDVIIEGIGPRFPIEIIDFEPTRYPKDAGWALYWDPNSLEQTITGDVRLYINRRHGAVVRAVTENLPRDRALRDALRYDIAKQMIFGTLMNQEFVNSSESFERGTVGDTVRHLILTCFPESSIKQVYEMAQRPAVFAPRIQARLKLFWEE